MADTTWGEGAKYYKTARIAVDRGDVKAGTIVGIDFQRWERDVITNKDVPVYFITGTEFNPTQQGNYPIYGTSLKDFVL